MAYPQENFFHTQLQPSSLVYKRREAVSVNTLLYQLDVLKRTGRYDAFKLRWQDVYSDTPNVWPIPNHLFWDSDVAKWIEGACYFLHKLQHPKILAAVHELVEFIRSAQQPDGYINIHFTVVEPGKRFTNLRDMHELYNAGHLIEAALAHHELFKTDALLEPMLKYVNLLHQTFGPNEGQIHGYPGHPEIELALLRLYRRTQDPKHLDLARFFITERGNPKGTKGQHFYEAEAAARGEDPRLRPSYWQSHDFLWYYQAHKPIVEQTTIEGHSVRAMYLLTGVTDLVHIERGDRHQDLLSAVYRLWNNMVEKKMYLTGGIGAIKQYEGFGIDHFLPQGTDEGGCYSETCAAIGVMMLAQRALQIELNGSLTDIMELCLYNAVLTAMSHDGTKFTYVNQLASSDKDLSKREEWFTCACCPPNILRLLGSISGYIWDWKPSTTAKAENGPKMEKMNGHLQETESININVHLFMPAIATVQTKGGSTIRLEQQTEWPWKGDIRFSVQGAKELGVGIGFSIRIPAWADSWELNPSLPSAVVSRGYLHLPQSYLDSNPEFTLSIPLSVRLLTPHPATNQDTVSLARGPIVYCVEDVDNPFVDDHFKSVVMSANPEITELEVQDEQTKDMYIGLSAHKSAGILNLNGQSSSQEKDRENGLNGHVDGEAGRDPTQSNTRLQGWPSLSQKELLRAHAQARMISELKFIPYYFRSNRGGIGHMRVGLQRWIR